MTDAAGEQRVVQHTCTKCGYITVTQYGEELVTRLQAVEAERESLEFSIRDAIHDLPDKGADALITLRAALQKGE